MNVDNSLSPKNMSQATKSPNLIVSNSKSNPVPLALSSSILLNISQKDKTKRIPSIAPVKLKLAKQTDALMLNPSVLKKVTGKSPFKKRTKKYLTPYEKAKVTVSEIEALKQAEKGMKYPSASCNQVTLHHIVDQLEHFEGSDTKYSGQLNSMANNSPDRKSNEVDNGRPSVIRKSRNRSQKDRERSGTTYRSPERIRQRKNSDERNEKDRDVRRDRFNRTNDNGYGYNRDRNERFYQRRNDYRPRIRRSRDRRQNWFNNSSRMSERFSRGDYERRSLYSKTNLNSRASGSTISQDNISKYEPNRSSESIQRSESSMKIDTTAKSDTQVKRSINSRSESICSSNESHLQNTSKSQNVQHVNEGDTLKVPQNVQKSIEKRKSDPIINVERNDIFKERNRHSVNVVTSVQTDTNTEFENSHSYENQNMCETYRLNEKETIYANNSGTKQKIISKNDEEMDKTKYNLIFENKNIELLPNDSEDLFCLKRSLVENYESKSDTYTESDSVDNLIMRKTNASNETSGTQYEYSKIDDVSDDINMSRNRSPSPDTIRKNNYGQMFANYSTRYSFRDESNKRKNSMMYRCNATSTYGVETYLRGHRDFLDGQPVSEVLESTEQFYPITNKYNNVTSYPVSLKKYTRTKPELSFSENPSCFMRFNRPWYLHYQKFLFVSENESSSHIDSASSFKLDSSVMNTSSASFEQDLSKHQSSNSNTEEQNSLVPESFDTFDIQPDICTATPTPTDMNIINVEPPITFGETKECTHLAMEYEEFIKAVTVQETTVPSLPDVLKTPLPEKQEPSITPKKSLQNSEKELDVSNNKTFTTDNTPSKDNTDKTENSLSCNEDMIPLKISREISSAHSKSSSSSDNESDSSSSDSKSSTTSSSSSTDSSTSQHDRIRSNSNQKRKILKKKLKQNYLRRRDKHKRKNRSQSSNSSNSSSEDSTSSDSDDDSTKHGTISNRKLLKKIKATELVIKREKLSSGEVSDSKDIDKVFAPECIIKEEKIDENICDTLKSNDILHLEMELISTTLNIPSDKMNLTVQSKVPINCSDPKIVDDSRKEVNLMTDLKSNLSPERINNSLLNYKGETFRVIDWEESPLSASHEDSTKESKSNRERVSNRKNSSSIESLTIVKSISELNKDNHSLSSTEYTILSECYESMGDLEDIPLPNTKSSSVGDQNCAIELNKIKLPLTPTKDKNELEMQSPISPQKFISFKLSSASRLPKSDVDDNIQEKLETTDDKPKTIKKIDYLSPKVNTNELDKKLSNVNYPAKEVSKMAKTQTITKSEDKPVDHNIKKYCKDHSTKSRSKSRSRSRSQSRSTSISRRPYKSNSISHDHRSSRKTSLSLERRDYERTSRRSYRRIREGQRYSHERDRDRDRDRFRDRERDRDRDWDRDRDRRARDPKRRNIERQSYEDRRKSRMDDYRRETRHSSRDQGRYSDIVDDSYNKIEKHQILVPSSENVESNIETIPLPRDHWTDEFSLSSDHIPLPTGRMNMECENSTGSMHDHYNVNYYNELSVNNYGVHLEAREPPTSPKRIPLDDRINQVLESNTGERSMETHHGEYFQSNQYGTGNYETGGNSYPSYSGYNNYGTYPPPPPAPPANIPTNVQNYNYTSQNMYQNYVNHAPNPRIRMDNLVNIVVNDSSTPTNSTEKEQILPEKSNNESKSQIVQVGNVLHVMPSNIPIDSPEPSPPNLDDTVAIQIQSFREAEELKRNETREKRSEDKKRRHEARELREQRRALRARRRNERRIMHAIDNTDDNASTETQTTLKELDEGYPNITQSKEDSNDNASSMQELPMQCNITKKTNPGKGILVLVGFRRSAGSSCTNKKSVKFADGILPGEGTSPSGGEEMASPPPPPPPPSEEIKLPEKKIRKKRKRKIGKRSFGRSVLNGEREENILAPPAPLGSPPLFLLQPCDGGNLPAGETPPPSPDTINGVYDFPQSNVQKTELSGAYVTSFNQSERIVNGIISPSDFTSVDSEIGGSDIIYLESPITEIINVEECNPSVPFMPPKPSPSIPAELLHVRLGSSVGQNSAVKIVQDKESDVEVSDDEEENLSDLDDNEADGEDTDNGPEDDL